MMVLQRHVQSILPKSYNGQPKAQTPSQSGLRCLTTMLHSMLACVLSLLNIKHTHGDPLHLFCTKAEFQSKTAHVKPGLVQHT